MQAGVGSEWYVCEVWTRWSAQPSKTICSHSVFQGPEDLAETTQESSLKSDKSRFYLPEFFLAGYS